MSLANRFTGLVLPRVRVDASQGVPSETGGSMCLNRYLNGVFSNPLRPHETSAGRRNPGRFWECPFRRTKLGGPIDQAGQVPQRDALRTIGRDQAGPGIYLFEGICRKPRTASGCPFGLQTELSPEEGFARVLRHIPRRNLEEEHPVWPGLHNRRSTAHYYGRTLTPTRSRYRALSRSWPRTGACSGTRASAVARAWASK